MAGYAKLDRVDDFGQMLGLQRAMEGNEHPLHDMQSCCIEAKQEGL